MNLRCGFFRCNLTSPILGVNFIKLKKINVRIRLLVLVSSILIILLGCASTSDIDLSKVERSYGQTCTKTYSEYLGKFTLFPIQTQQQCTDALRLCAQSCPARAPVVAGTK